MDKPKILIAVLARAKDTEKRKTIDETWGSLATEHNIDYAFLVGDPSKKINRLTKTKELILTCPDGYNHLPSKVRMCCNWVLSNHSAKYDYIFKCDDDTYIDIPRFLEYFNNILLPSRHDYVGRKINEAGTASGGAGYFLSRTAYTAVANSSIEKGAEDVEVSRVLMENGIEITNVPLFDPWGKEIPDKSNVLITSHYVSPEKMISIFNQEEVLDSPVVEETVPKPEPKPKPQIEKQLPTTSGTKLVQSENIPTGNHHDWASSDMEPIRYQGNYTKDSTIFVIGPQQFRFFEKFFEVHENAGSVYYFDPVQEYYSYLKKNKYKVKHQQCAIDNFECRKTIFMKNASTSMYNQTGPTRRVDCTRLSKFIEDRSIKTVDLLVLNSEGSEYGTFEDLFDTGKINVFKKIQVQFHENVPGYSDKRDQILTNLKKIGFVKTYSFPFVWEEFVQS